MAFLKELQLIYAPRGQLSADGQEVHAPAPDARTISKILDPMKIVSIFLSQELRQARIEMNTPPTIHVGIRLTRIPDPKLNHRTFGTTNSLWIDRPFDPDEFLNIQKTPEAMGEFVLGCWEWAMPRLEAETDFPGAFLREQIEKFRAQGYAMGSTLKPAAIKGSKARARVHGSVSCTRTILKVEVTYRKKRLFERVIWDVPEQAFNIAYSKREFAVEDGQFKVRGARPIGNQFLLPEVAFDLEGLLEDFLRTLT